MDSPGFWKAGLAAIALAASGHAAAQIPGERIAGGLVFRVGLSSGQQVAAGAARGAEPMVHGKRPARGKDHLVLVLTDARSGERIADATVTADVNRSGVDHTRLTLSRMDKSDAPSYGAWLELGQPGPYRIRIRAARPGQADPAVAEFNYDKR